MIINVKKMKWSQRGLYETSRLVKASSTILHFIWDLEKARENLGKTFLGNKINQLKDCIVVKSLPYLETERKKLTVAGT